MPKPRNTTVVVPNVQQAVEAAPAAQPSERPWALLDVMAANVYRPIVPVDGRQMAPRGYFCQRGSKVQGGGYVVLPPQRNEAGSIVAAATRKDAPAYHCATHSEAVAWARQHNASFAKPAA